jgi:hypothetical protein
MSNPAVNFLFRETLKTINMEMFDHKQVVKIMEEHGFKFTAENHAKNVLFFLKMFDNKKLHIHATVTLATHLIDLDTTGNLDLGVTLYCDSIDIENVKFPEFEKKLYNYLYLCVYGTPLHTVEDDPNNGLYFKTQTGGSEAVPASELGSKSVGGVTEGKGEPSKKPSIKDRKLKFWEEVKGVAKQKGYPKELAIEFYTYWAETNQKNTAFRREKETFFDIPKRFATWIKNDKKWANKTFVQQDTEREKQEITNTNKNIKKHKDLF